MIASHNKTIYEALGRESVHPFPARMAPGIALDALTETDRPITVLDPMMGSGTVLALARAKGHRAFGFDLDPLAVLISQVWTTAINPDEVQKTASRVLDRAQKQLEILNLQEAYPTGADDETCRFVQFWFDKRSRVQLTSLARAIERVRDETVRAVLWCGFSRLIIAKQAGASLAMDLAHSRPHKSFYQAPVKPFDKFISSTNRVVENCIDQTKNGRGPPTIVHVGDARKLSLRNGSIDLVLTSPPYLNAIDYMRCSKFSLVWMGHSIEGLRRTRSQSVGTEAGDRTAANDSTVKHVISRLRLQPRLDSRREAMLARYIKDMHSAMNEAARVLAPGGKAVYVVGENTIRGTYIPNSLIVSLVAEMSGLALQTRRSRKLPANRRYLPPPSDGSQSAALDGRMRREVILTFKKFFQ